MLKFQIFVLVLLLECLKLSFADWEGNIMEGHIVDGVAASIDKYPHSAFVAILCIKIESNREKRDTYACGSSIINQWFLMSASHCFEECIPNRSKAIVSVGSASKTKVTDEVLDIRLHEYYDPQHLTNDIALILLKRPIIFSKRVKRVVLMRSPPPDTNAEVAGWGLINEKKRIDSEKLMVASQKILSHNRCMKTFGFIPPGTFCANSVKGYAAEGDSGSALLLRGYIQVGIVSYKEDHISVSTIVYTNVSMYLDWVQWNMRRMRCRGKR